LVRTIEQRIRAFTAKIQKVPLVHSYKYARLRMLEDFTSNVKALARLEWFTEKESERCAFPLFARKLYFLFTKWAFKHFAKHYPRWSELYLATLREKLVRKIAYNFWLDKIPPFDQYTLNQLIQLSYDEICTLIDQTGEILCPIKSVIKAGLEFTKTIACHLMGNVPLGYADFKYYHALRLTPEEVTNHTRGSIEVVRIGYKIYKVKPEVGLTVVVYSVE